MEKVLQERVADVSFSDRKKMLDFLGEMCSEDLWINGNLKNLMVTRINPNSTPTLPILIANKKQIDEMYQYGGYLLSVGHDNYLMNDLAWFTLKDRAGVSSKYYNHLLANEKYDKVVELVNSTWSEYEGSCKILIRGGYVLAVHSEKYGILNQAEIFSTTENFIATSFPNAEFKKGSYTHEATSIIFSLSDSKSKIVQSYANAWINAGFNESALEKSFPQLKVATCDVGLYCCTVYPQLEINNTIYPLGDKLVVKHWGKNSIDTVTHLLPQAFSAIENGVDKLANLININIDYPVEVAIRASEEVGLHKNAKKALKTIINDFKDTLYFSDTFTAFEIYSLLCEITNTEEFKKMSPTAKLKVSEGLYRLLNLNWKEFNKPGRTEL